MSKWEVLAWSALAGFAAGVLFGGFFVALAVSFFVAFALTIVKK